MIFVAWIISLIAVFFLGYYFRGIHIKIEHIEKVVEAKVDKKPVVEESSTVFIDPYDEISRAQNEHDQLMRKLNP